jgi:DNA invertase Pin-like site-specific DNA recombinase
MLVGYARVSTEDQDNTAQRRQLLEAGCEVIFEDKASGASRDRPQLAAALAKVRRGDTLVIVRIDRLARSLSHLLSVVEGLQRRGAYFRSITDPIDTASPQGMLMAQLLGAVAEFERTLIRERTKAGVRSAIARGRRPGNPKMRSRDPEAIAMLRATLADRYIEELEATRHNWLPTVERLRPMLPWKAVVRQLSGRSDVGRTFTERTLVKACHALVGRGLASRHVLGRSPTKPINDRVARLLADRVRAQPGEPLRRLAIWLSEDLREPTPRGGYHWSPEGVRRELEKAKRMKLI